MKTFSDIEKFFIKRRKLGIKLGLERVTDLLSLVGNPEKTFPAIHIAGTNGKGSTIQFLQNSLTASGYRVGTYTSPSFTDLSGHFLIDGKQISKEDTEKVFSRLLPAINELDKVDNHPTEYEILTVMAFLYFTDNVDIALIETAMGGKEDTTNCFIPILSIITNVAIDHIDYLGNTIEQITDHKAGIMKLRRPAIIGEVSPTSKEIIADVSRRLEVPVYYLGEDFLINQAETSVTYKTAKHMLALEMQGEHQLKNAAVALMALHVLEREGYSIDWLETVRAINKTTLVGRYEVMCLTPRIILDSAHNLAGIEAFLQTVSRDASREKEVLFAAFQDKDFPVMIDVLKQEFQEISLTTFNHPRAATLATLSVHARENNIHLVNDWEAKLQEILASKNDITYYITGSMHFIMIVRKYLLSHR